MKRKKTSGSRPRTPDSGLRTFLAAALLLLAVPAAASVVETAHETEVTSGEGAVCLACHIPHQARGERFWPSDPVAEGLVGEVSAMCAGCHRSGGAYGALMTRAFSDRFVYGPDSHGQKMRLGSVPPGTEPAAAGLPGVSLEHGRFECSTCHTVHDDTHRPFLREPPNALCARCHKLRHYVGGTDRSGPVVEPGNWGVPSRLGAGNPGSHPVGDDVTGARDGAPAVTIPALFRTPFSPEPRQWSLGGHLSRGEAGGVTCITCHAVHGVQPDADDITASGAETPPGPAFLAVAQAAVSIPGYPRKVPNGGGGTSALCEACHGVGNNPPRAPDGSDWADKKRNVSPGRKGTASHPVDSYPSGYDARVGAFPPNWPEGDPGLAGANVGPVPVCGTCHASHAAAALSAGRADVLPGAGAWALRAPMELSRGEPLCDLCHAETIPGHHPVDKAYDSRGVPYLAGAVAGQGDVLTCHTCHNGAHNWTAPGWASLDPGWKPRDNGRSLDQRDDMYDPDMGKTCMDCHYFMDGDGASVSPTLGSQQTVIRPGDDEYPHYQAADRSSGTHYVGLIHEGGEWQLAPWVDVFDTGKTWKEQSSEKSGGLAPGWARFGGEDRPGSRVLVCESCHELEPDRNGGFRHLLLAPYEEGQNGWDEYSGDEDGRDVLCEACHGATKGVHPMTGMIVSKTEKPLQATAEWLKPEPLGYATMDRVNNAMSCDSCHQPHSASSMSLTFALDVPETGAIGDYTKPQLPGDVDPAKPSEAASYGYLQAGGNTPGTYATPTLSATGFSYDRVCRQCHNQ